MSKVYIEGGTVAGANLQPMATFCFYDTPTCSICGCTEKAPCFDGGQACFWVTMNKETNGGICSECLGF